MAPRNIIVIGASWGGLKAFKEILSGLPENLPAAVFIVQHIAPDAPGLLSGILNRSGELPAFLPRDHEPIKLGNVYVAPPDHHLLLEKGFIRITRGPKENRARPSVDVLFRSAAYAYGSSVIGVVLTGHLEDGSAGLWAIKDRGGTSIIQDPAEAEAPSMPDNALRQVEIDYQVPLREIAPLLMELSATSVNEEPRHPPSEGMRLEVAIASEDRTMETEIKDLFEPSTYACPECHGVLMKIPEGNHTRYRCHTGHAYSGLSLISHISETTEETLWTAIRSIQEGAFLLREFAEERQRRGNEKEYRMLLEKAEEAQRRADTVRLVAMSHEKVVPPNVEGSKKY